MNPLLRLARPVLIGSGAAAVVGAAVYGVQEYQLSNIPYHGHISSEWGVETKVHLRRACGAHAPAERAAELQSAISSVLKPQIDLQKKSEDWLRGYSDLLVHLGLAQLEAGDRQDAVQALSAAETIPQGNKHLKAQAALARYELGVLAASQLPKVYSDLEPPVEITTDEGVRAWGPLALEAARTYIDAGKTMQALELLLAFHKSSVSKEDMLCLKQTCGGYIAQLLWLMGDKEGARGWLEISALEAAKCGSNACKQTLAMLNEFKRKAA